MVVWEALDALSHQLELCRIDATSSVLVVLDDHTSGHRDLIRAAVARSGADAIEVRPIHTDHGEARVAEPGVFAAALAGADVVITCLHDPSVIVLGALARSTCRVLHLRAQGLAPQDYPPHANLRHRVMALVDHVENASELAITDSFGTTLTVGLAGGAVSFDHGLITENPAPVHYPAGWVAITPAQALVHGDVVLMPGDTTITASRTITSPLRLQIRDGQLSAIEGDHADADVVRAILEYRKQPSVYRVVQVSIGLNPGKGPVKLFDPRLLDPQLCQLTAGVVVVWFGQNLITHGEPGIVFGLPRRTVRLDGHLPVVSEGVLDGDFAPDVYEL